MRNTIFFSTLCFFLLFVNPDWQISAQISYGGTPPSFKQQQTLRSNQAIWQVPITFDVEELKKEDSQLASEGAPLAIATIIKVDLNPKNSGFWSILPDGEKIWQLHLQAKDANGLMLYYSDFQIPEGGKLFIYNADKTQILGAYTQMTYPSGGRFATEFIIGDEITIEYVASPNDESPRIEIEAIGYGYNLPLGFQPSGLLRRASGSCEVNVNCAEGDAWQNQKKAVCFIAQRIGGRTYSCSGSLINNTAQDLKPYILTAQHCSWSGTTNATQEDLEQWIFQFHWEKTGCDNNSQNMAPKSMIGCRKVAETTTNKQSDGLLLLINNQIPDNYQVYYNGWDRRNEIAQSGVSIHHPLGDYKKISTFTKPTMHYTYQDGFMQGDENAHWNAEFAATPNGHGVTENGSSGAPLFNENKLIIGTLTGGNSTCSFPTALNLYGKISYHWNKYTQSDTTRMDKWLDPANTGVEVLKGRYHFSELPAPTSLKAIYGNNKVVLSWKAPTGQQPQKYFIYNDSHKIGETGSLSFTDLSPKIGFQTYGVTAIYENNVESDFDNTSITVTEFKTPQNISVTHTTTEKVAVLWKAPIYEQTLYWGESTPLNRVSMDGVKLFYFGQQWSKEEIQFYHKKSLTAIKFIPIRNNSYEIYIKQGERIYRQPIDNLSVGITHRVELNTPFVIANTEPLIVSIYVSKHSGNENQFPAVCDAGPAIQGKGNIYSYDGITWENLYKPEKPNEFNYNFFIAAIVSSKEGELPPTYSLETEIRTTNPKTAQNNLRIAPFDTKLNIQLQSQEPVKFPEVTEYIIYRNNEKIATVAGNLHRYIDEPSNQVAHYQVSAKYGIEESKRSDSVSIYPLSNLLIEKDKISIYPTFFTDQVELKGFGQVKRLEIYSTDGKCWLQVNRPESIIRTESFAPGVYFFRIYLEGEEPITIRGVKRRN